MEDNIPRFVANEDCSPTTMHETPHRVKGTLGLSRRRFSPRTMGLHAREFKVEQSPSSNFFNYAQNHS